MEGVALVVPRLLVRRVNREGPIVAGQGFVVDPEHEEREAFVVPGLRMARVRIDRAVVGLDRLLVSLEGVQRVPESRPRVRVLRIRVGRGLVGVPGLLEPLQFLEQPTSSGPIDRTRDVRPDEQFVNLEGGPLLPEAREHEGLVEERVGMVGPNRQRAVVRDQRFIKASELRVCVPEVVRRDVVRRVPPHRARVRLDRFFRSSEGVERDPAVVPQNGVVVPGGRGPLVAGEGRRELAGVAVGVPAEEFRLAPRQVLRRRDVGEGEEQGEAHRESPRIGTSLKVPRWASEMRASERARSSQLSMDTPLDALRRRRPSAR